MSAPKKEEDGVRRYGQWAGNPKGLKEEVTRCIEEVWPSVSWVPVQCSRKRGHGPNSEYCKQHAKRTVP